VETNESASIAEEPLQTLAYLFVRQVLASVECVFTLLHGFNESDFIFEILSDNIARKITRLPALLGRRPR
jgi:hypothetical protein